MTEKNHFFIVIEKEKDSRLDLFLAERESDMSRSQVARAINEGRVTVNEKKAKAGQRLKVGDAIRFMKREPSQYHVSPEDLPLHIVYEDPYLLIVDKPAGMVIHPAPGHYDGTLVNAILFHCRDLSGIGGVLRPGIVHRLDKDTSGLLVVAKSDEAHRGLASQFKEHRIKKTYKVLVHGNIKGEQGFVDLPVGRHPVDRKKMSVRSRKGKEALSRWRVCERYGPATLLEVDIETGRTHQIRVHLNALGYPVVGDRVYGKKGNIKEDGYSDITRKLKNMERQALHAYRLSFLHPVTGKPLDFISPLPSDMADLCESIRGEING
jgi:23S rRNA pseudouridine1911/1915/1917 synthase